MSNFILITVVEREISTSFFPTMKLAQTQMEQEISNAMEWNEQEKEECIKIGYEECPCDFSITETTAWANTSNDNYDWLIVETNKPFVLVSVVDREICVTECDTLKEAQERMFEDFKKSPDWAEWEDEFEFDEETCEYGVHDMYAWANADDGDMDCDWFIVDVSKYVFLKKE